MNCDLWTAVQAYNFGTDYIDYVAARGGVNTLELAETYSREVLSPLLGNDTEQTYRYWGIQSVFIMVVTCIITAAIYSTLI